MLTIALITIVVDVLILILVPDKYFDPITIGIIMLAAEVIMVILLPDKYFEKYSTPKKSHRRWFSSSGCSSYHGGLRWTGKSYKKRNRYL